MGDKSKIEWTEATWNPTVGCSVISPGCTNCYAMKMAARIELMSQSRIPRRGGRPKPTHYIGTTQPSKAGPVWTGKLALAPDDILFKPLSWKRPRMIFVNSMSDLFHESVPDEWIDRVFAVMALAPQHTFQVLTKRAERMRAYLAGWPMKSDVPDRITEIAREIAWSVKHGHQGNCGLARRPLPNVWLGVSAEDQKRADERIPHLIATPASMRFVSAEPLLGPIDFMSLNIPRRRGTALLDALTCDLRDHLGQVLAGPPSGHGPIDWIIVGGESGPNARPMHPDWARSIRDQCQAAGVPYFFKQWGEHAPNGSGRYSMIKVGKRAAGRLLDGREHNEMPERANG